MLRWYDKRRTWALRDFRILVLASKSEIIVQGRMDKPSAQAIIDAAGISRTHAYDILAEREVPSLKVAFDIYDATGAQFGILKGCAETTIEDLRRQAA
jgi:hypothetical protein